MKLKMLVIGVLMMKAQGLTISSEAFKHGQIIPAEYTCTSANSSPHLSWHEAPEGTVTYALICDDPDAPKGTWVHWVIYNIPASVHELAKGFTRDAELRDGTRQGKNDFKRLGYDGPCPPAGKPHRYYFKLYALSKKLDVLAGATKETLEKAMQGAILAQAELMGTFQTT